MKRITIAVLEAVAVATSLMPIGAHAAINIQYMQSAVEGVQPSYSLSFSVTDTPISYILEQSFTVATMNWISPYGGNTGAVPDPGSVTFLSAAYGGGFEFQSGGITIHPTWAGTGEENQEYSGYESDPIIDDAVLSLSFYDNNGDLKSHNPFPSPNSADIEITGGFGSMVPEPATWATMLIGLGMVGAVIRHLRARGTFVAAAPLH